MLRSEQLSRDKKRNISGYNELENKLSEFIYFLH